MTDGEGIGAAPVSLLLVCRANVCRSPLAEEFVRRAFAGGGWLDAVAVSSAGLETKGGWRMCGLAGEALGEEGMPFVAGHRSRPLSEELVSGAHLVLTMETGYRTAVAQRFPRSQANVFTLGEAAWLLRAAEGRVRMEKASAPADLPDLVDLIRSMRGMVPPPEVERPRGLWRRRPAAEPFTIEDGHNLGDRAHQVAVGAVLDASAAFAETAVRLAGLHAAR